MPKLSTAAVRSRIRGSVLAGLLPVRRDRLAPEVLAGVTLAALAVPEVLGYATIAGMPVATGLYTMLLPLAVFALLGSSRHLVVGADSATAAILAAGLAGSAAAGSAQYVRLAGTAALLCGALLLLARLIRLGFLANFLSRTVLVGFLTGVGIQVAARQLGEMLGVRVPGGNSVAMLVSTLRGIGRVHPLTALMSLAVVAVVLGARLLTRRIPGALLAVVGAIVLSELAHLAAHGVAVLGPVPRGLPHLALPAFAPHDLATLLPMSLSMFVVILAQSAATSRAYASKYDETVDENADLVGLGGANIAAAFTGAFVVNGSPTKTEIVDSAGGRSQLAQVVTGAVVLLVLLVLTGPLAFLPIAALATVVFLIAAGLIDIRGMRRIYQVRRTEFVVALVTAAAVVFVGVEQGLALAIVISVVDHLRHSYDPPCSVLVKSSAGHWQPMPVTPGRRTSDGLVIYRFGSSLYFANAPRLLADIATLTQSAPAPVWFCLDGAAIGDVDYTAAAVLARARELVQGTGARLVLSSVIGPVREQLARYGLTETLGADALFDTAGEALDAFHARARAQPPA